MSIARFEEWPALRDGEGGVTWEEAQKLYGTPLRPDQDADSPVYKQGLAALRLLRASVLGRYGMTQAQLLRGADPALQALFSHNVILTRAVLLPVPGSSPRKFIPVSHIGPEGYVLLTLAQSQESMQGQRQQADPPGGFAPPGFLRKLDGAARAVNQGLSHPAVRATGGILSLGLLMKAAINALT